MPSVPSPYFWHLTHFQICALPTSKCLPISAFLSPRAFEDFLEAMGLEVPCLSRLLPSSPPLIPTLRRSGSAMELIPTHTSAALNQWLTLGWLTLSCCILYWFPEFPSGLCSSYPKCSWLYNIAFHWLPSLPCFTSLLPYLCFWHFPK